MSNPEQTIESLRSEIARLSKELEGKRNEQVRVSMEDITDLKLKEELPREQRQFLEEKVEQRTAELKIAKEYAENLIETASIMVIGLDKEGSINVFNENAEQVTGYKKSEVQGKNWFDIIAPRSQYPQVWEEFNRLMVGGVQKNFENPIINKAGEERHIVWRNNQVREQGRITGSISFGIDITARKQAEEALRISEEKYTAVFDGSPVGMILIDIETRTPLAINKAYTRVTGYDSEEVVGIPGRAGTLIADESHEKREQAFDMAALGKRVDGIVVNLDTKYNDQRELILFAEPIVTRGRKLCVASALDITERNQAERELKESEKRFRSLVENMPSITWMTEGKDKIVFVSPNIKNLLGYTPKQAIEGTMKWWYSKIHPDDRNKSIQVFRDSVKQGIDHYLEYRVRRADGKFIWISDQSHSFQGKGRNAVAIGSLSDIHSRKLAQMEIQNLKERLEAENVYLRKEIRLAHTHGNIIASSESMKSVLLQAEQVAKTDSSVLILGETGTGKELLTRAIHNMSSRKDRSLVVVNCTAMPSNLVESELFGHEKGAFTGAFTKQIGRFEAADGGTIFLDEIGELSIDLQAKLLRVLQEGQFERLGSNKTITAEVRIIAATNRNLEELVKEKKFRSDLFFRLNVFPITIPPLRDRVDDIKPLVVSVVEEFASKMGKRIKSISRPSMNSLMKYSWPGNVRELRNVIERAMIRSTGPKLEISIPKIITSLNFGKKSLADTERSYILSVLKEVNWKVRGKGGAAEILEINPSTLESRMKKLSIKRPV